MDLEVTSEALTAMRQAARVAHPHEACGVLLGAGCRITAARQAANVHPTPATHFEIDPQALIDAHPVGEPVPSATDRASASGDGRVWAILAGEDVRFWKDGAEGFAALSYTLAKS
jgi:proteasome lid subunit RPN8/RPN11